MLVLGVFHNAPHLGYKNSNTTTINGIPIVHHQRVGSHLHNRGPWLLISLISLSKVLLKIESAHMPRRRTFKHPPPQKVIKRHTASGLKLRWPYTRQHVACNTVARRNVASCMATFKRCYNSCFSTALADTDGNRRECTDRLQRNRKTERSAGEVLSGGQRGHKTPHLLVTVRSFC